MAKIATLTDDFADGVLTPLWTTQITGAGSITESNGRVNLSLTTAAGTLFLVSAVAYDLTESQVVVQSTAFTNNGQIANSVQCGLSVGSSSSNFVAFRKVVDRLQATKTVGGVQTILYDVPFNATNHKWWRIRQTGGLLLWDISNGVGWTQVFSVFYPSQAFDVSACFVNLYAEHVNTQSNPGTFSVDVINPGLSITASGASVSSGSADIRRLNRITASGASASAGSAVIVIFTPPSYTITATGDSTSSGAAFLTVAGIPNEVTATGLSSSSGSATIRIITEELTAFGQSFSGGSASLQIIALTTPVYTYLFEPPIVYDIPPFLPDTKGWQRVHARWRNNQPRGRTVLKLSEGELGLYPESNLYPSADLFPEVSGANATYITVDTPSVEQMAAALFAYQGGHIYEVSEVEARQLVNAGYSVSSAPTIPPAPPIIPESQSVVPSPTTLPSPTLVL